MPAASIAFAAFFCITGYVYIFKAVQEQIEIQHEINRKLPPDQQFEPTFWGHGTNQRFRDLQRDLLPESPRPQRLRRFRLIGFTLLASGVLIVLATLGKLGLM